ncbi:MAG: PorT family protein [Bacteroidales bacterium]|nr:PorT family protein [Bacteroidales bacterium]
MKKIIAIAFAALVLAGTNAFAQLYPGLGYINSTFSGQYNGNAIDPEISNGVYAGASFNVALPGGLAVAPGLYASYLTNTTEGSGGISGIATVNSKTVFTEIALNAPVMVNYTYALNRDAKVFAYAGPTFQLGLSSKSVNNTKADTAIGSGSSNSTKDYYADGDYNKFNIYLGGGVGAEFAKVLVTIGYDYGLMNLYAGSTENTNYHRANLHIGVGYAF